MIGINRQPKSTLAIDSITIFSQTLLLSFIGLEVPKGGKQKENKKRNTEIIESSPAAKIKKVFKGGRLYKKDGRKVERGGVTPPLSLRRGMRVNNPHRLQRSRSGSGRD